MQKVTLYQDSVTGAIFLRLEDGKCVHDVELRALLESLLQYDETGYVKKVFNFIYPFLQYVRF